MDRAFTGRANLFAETAGVLVVDEDGIDRLNEVDPDITLATLEAFAPVVVGKMIATVKIIPFAVAREARDRALAAARAATPLVRVAPYKIRKVGVISTLLPGLADKVIDKTLRVTLDRLAPANATIVAERRVPHETTALARALDELLNSGAELVIVFGASAIADKRDVIPAAVEAVGDHRADSRHAGRSRQSDAGGARERPSGARRARLRAQPKEIGRPDSGASLVRPAGDAARHHRHGRRRPSRWRSSRGRSRARASSRPIAAKWLKCFRSNFVSSRSAEASQP